MAVSYVSFRPECVALSQRGAVRFVERVAVRSSDWCVTAMPVPNEHVVARSHVHVLCGAGAAALAVVGRA